jgi:adenosylcobinamide-GDP ribazoletransferase
MNGKFSMTLLAKISKSAAPGSNTYFITAMSEDSGLKRLILSSGVTLLLAYLLEGERGIITFIFAFVTTFVISLVSQRHFGGVTGDVFVGTNEITRLVSLVALVALGF